MFDHISFTISDDQRIGLIGVNGTGKSSLLKVLAGIDEPEDGRLVHANRFRVEYLTQQPELDDELTVLDQIFIGDSDIMRTLREYEETLYQLEQQPQHEPLQKRLFSVQQHMDELQAWEAGTAAKTVLTRLGITKFSKQVKELSGGQRKRIAIAKALIQPCDLLMMDEPTNHLDHETIEWLEGYLGQYRGALIVVTHDRYFLNRVTNRIFELDQGKLYVYDGNYEMFLEKKAEREEQESQDNQKRQNVLRRELAWLRRGARARSTKQKARVEQVHQLQETAGGTSETQTLDIALAGARLGKKVIELNEVMKSYDGRSLFEPFSYLITPGERLGIIGPNGSGKSTLLDLMAGRVQPDSGSIETGETVRIGYYTQGDEEIDGALRVIEYIQQTAEVVRTSDDREITAEQMLERFLFSRPDQWTYIRKLSGGERRRLYLLKVLMSEPNVLMLDEPTNDLDTQTLTILEEYLEQFRGVVIAVSHDRYFLDRVADRLLTFEGAGSIHRHEGSYTEYLHIQKQQAEADRERKAAGKRDEKPAEKAIARKKKLSYQDQKEWEGIEDRIAAAEARGEELDAAIAAAGSDSQKVQELYQQKQEAEQQQEQLMERWTELSLLVEELESQGENG